MFTELEPNKIYKDSGGYWIFRNDEKCWFINIQEKVFINREINLFNPRRCKLATEEEKMWLEYCESVGEYRTKQEAIENSYAIQFVREYLTEE